MVVAPVAGVVVCACVFAVVERDLGVGFAPLPRPDMMVVVSYRHVS